MSVDVDENGHVVLKRRDECAFCGQKRSEIADLRAKLAEAERERDEAVKMLSDSLIRESRTASIAEQRSLLYRKLNGDLVSAREAMRADRDEAREIAANSEQAFRVLKSERDALAERLSEAHSLCYRASRSNMLPAEILADLAAIVED